MAKPGQQLAPLGHTPIFTSDSKAKLVGSVEDLHAQASPGVHLPEMRPLSPSARKLEKLVVRKEDTATPLPPQPIDEEESPIKEYGG